MERRASPRTLGIVVTTISDGAFLEAYRRALEEPVTGVSARLYVAGDVNTPPACRDRARRMAAEGAPIIYLDLEEQAEILRPFPRLAEAIPVRSDARRNLGYLRAFADRCDVIVSVDDDNLPGERTGFVAGHAVTGTEIELPTTQSANGWFNVGRLLTTTDRHGTRVTVYPRGFPHARRFADRSATGGPIERGRVGINVGLWTGDPDVEAATRLVLGVSARPSDGVEAVWMARGHRTPINTQNTSLVWDAIPAYYFVAMGAELDGIAIGRFGDIFSGYFVQLCAEAVGDRVRVGGPWLNQARNEHHLLSDLRYELPGMLLIEEMVELLEAPLNPAPSYSAAYRALADRLDVWARNRNSRVLKADHREFLLRTARDMLLWCDACTAIAGGEPGRSVR